MPAAIVKLVGNYDRRPAEQRVKMDRRPLLRFPDSGHYDAASDAGGRRAAAIYTLIATAKLNDINPQAWLADVLARIADHPASRLSELLPWHWKAAQLQAAA